MKTKYINWVLVILYASSVVYLAYQIPDIVKPWFAVLWGAIYVVTAFRTEIRHRDWLGSETDLRLPPQIQLLFALALLIGAVVATDWGHLALTAVIQWASALFVLPVFSQGLRWLWTRLHQCAGG